MNYSSKIENAKVIVRELEIIFSSLAESHEPAANQLDEILGLVNLLISRLNSIPEVSDLSEALADLKNYLQCDSQLCFGAVIELLGIINLAIGKGVCIDLIQELEYQRKRLLVRKAS